MKKKHSCLFTLLFILVFVIQSITPTAAADNGPAFTTAYARTVLRASVGLATADGETLRSYDLDANRILTPADARIALRCAVGLDSYTPPTDEGFAAATSAIADVSAHIYTYEELEEDLATLSRLMPSRFTYSSLATTADGRNIYCAVLGSGFANKQIIVDAGIHGSEYLNPAAVMSAIEYCLRNYDAKVYDGKTVREILRDTDIYVFPMFNPDGIAISQFGLDGIRSSAIRENIQTIYKTQRNAGNTYDSFDTYLKVWKSNARGVDLNRNFMIEKDGKPYYSGLSSPANELYAGAYPFSEPETQAYKTVVERASDPVAVLSIHSQGKLIYWDCEQNSEGKQAAKRLAYIVEDETGYYLDMSDSFVGASADWTMIEKNIPSVTVECGRGHNPLPLAQQAEIEKAIRTLFLAVAAAY
ncbi:MAG: hypothetical protein IJC45_04070 [Clostridia bacterium]|nr:hypothetical protein [Clostridia bacterium]